MKSVLAASLVILGAVGPSASAVTIRNWTGASLTSGNWTTAANWQGNVAPAAGDFLAFAPGGARRTSNTNNFPAGTIFFAIDFEDNDYRLRGNAITVTNGITVAQNCGTNVVDLDVIVGPTGLALRTFGATDMLIINGDINLGSHTLSTTGPGDIHIGGPSDAS